MPQPTTLPRAPFTELVWQRSRHRNNNKNNIGKTAFFELQSSLEGSARLHQVFTSLNFCNNNFLHGKVVSLAAIFIGPLNLKCRCMLYT
jgi:hypothetical protein